MKNLLFLFLFFIGMTLASCGGCGSKPTSDAAEESSSSTTSTTSSSEESGGESTEGEPKNLEEAIQQMEKAVEESGIGEGAVEPLNFRELQKRLDENLAGMERTSKSGETAGALGMKVSTAEAKYKDKDGTIYEVSIADVGGIGMGLMGMAAWSMATIDKEDENGSERTTTLDGFKAYEQTRNSDQSCELSVIAKGRYVATAKCRQCKMEPLRKIVRAMDLDVLPEGEKK